MHCIHEAYKEPCKHRELEKGNMRNVSSPFHGYSTNASYNSEELEEGEIREDDQPRSENHIQKGMLAGAVGLRSSTYKKVEKGHVHPRQSTSLEKGFDLGMLSSSKVVPSSDCKEIENGPADMRQSSLLGTSYSKQLTDQSASSSVCNRPKERHKLKEHGYFKHSQFDWYVQLCKHEVLEKIDKVCSARLDQLLLLQKKDLQEFQCQKKKQQSEFLQAHHMNSYKIHARHVIPIVKDYRMKLPKQQSSILFERFHKHLQSQLKKFIRQQIEDRNREKKIKERWIEKAKVGNLEEHFDEISLSHSGFEMEKFKWDLTDSADNEEPLKYFDMQCLSTEIEAIASTRKSEDILENKSGASTKPILANSVSQLLETNGVREIGVSLGAAGEMPSVVDDRSCQPTCANMVEFREKVGTQIARSAALLHEEDIMGKPSTSQTVTGAIIKCSKAVNSENDPIAREKRRRIGSDNYVSEGSNSKSQKKFPSGCALNSCKVASDHKKPPPARLPSVSNDQAENAATREAHNHQTQMSEVTANVAQQQQYNSICQISARPCAQLTGHGHTQCTRTGSDCLGASNAQVGPANQARTGSKMQQFLPENGPQSNRMTLSRLLELRNLITKKHEEKKVQLIMARESELAQSKRKFDELMHNLEMEVLKSQKNLKTICDKIYRQQILAEGFQGLFKAAGGVVSNSFKDASKGNKEQSNQSSQHEVSQIPPSVQTPASADIHHSLQSLVSSTTDYSCQRPSVMTQHTATASLSRLTTTLAHPPGGVTSTGITYRAPAPHLRAYVNPLAASSFHFGVASSKK